MSMGVGERDKKMDELATKGATAFCRKYEDWTDQQIDESPEPFLRGPIGYLTVRTLHRVRDTLDRQEQALKSWNAIRDGSNG